MDDCIGQSWHSICFYWFTFKQKRLFSTFIKISFNLVFYQNRSKYQINLFTNFPFISNQFQFQQFDEKVTFLKKILNSIKLNISFANQIELKFKNILYFIYILKDPFEFSKKKKNSFEFQNFIFSEFALKKKSELDYFSEFFEFHCKLFIVIITLT